MKRKSVTLADIALKAGVHKSTVTRALRNDPRVQPKTIQRVSQVAKSLKYQPNPVASALSEMRWRHGNRVRLVNFGFLGVAKSDAHLSEDSQYRRVRKRAGLMGYELLPLALNRNLTPEILSRRMKSQNIRGVVLDAIGYDQQLFPSFDWDAVNWGLGTWVSLGEGEYTHPGYRVLHNAFLATMVALRSMVALGYRRIHFARDPSQLRWELWREQAGALLVCKEHPHLIVSDENDPNPPESVDGVLGSDATIASQTAKRMGGLPWASLAVRDSEDTNEAGMYINPEAPVAAAVELLDRSYRRGVVGLPNERQTIMLESQWRDGRNLPSKASGKNRR